MEIIATAKFQRVAPRKASLVADSLRGVNAQKALDMVSFIPNSGAKFLSKVLKSAINNAVNNSKLERSTLRIKAIEINEGPMLKRGRAVARGTFHQIKKRTSHIKITLDEENK